MNTDNHVTSHAHNFSLPKASTNNESGDKERLAAKNSGIGAEGNGGGTLAD